MDALSTYDAPAAWCHTVMINLLIDRADRALGDFALAYAAQNQLDYDALVQAIAGGRIEARSDL